ncbi:MAG: hypothetical protein KGN36_04920 [Acidobacteriota bacterium]|nr:hypothetical protein [Acidobacteriota bacterium]
MPPPAPSPSTCFLVADDLTGACDAAVHFAARGLRVSVPLSPSAPPETAVLAVSTESRALTPPQIRARIRDAARIPSTRPRILFKKIDSTLRGLPGVEIAAALDAFACAAALVCPAFPALHRIVRDGRLAVATAPDFPAIDVAAHLRAQGLHAALLRAPADLADAVASGARAIVLDAATDADLDRIAAAGLALGAPLLWAGSGGLAAALARTLAPAAHSLPVPAPSPGPALLIIGSDHPVTLAQQQALASARRVEILDAASAAPESVRNALTGPRPVLLRVPWGRVSASQLRASLDGAPARPLLLSGGDTASLFCRAAQVERIDLIAEIVPGIPRSLLRGGLCDGLSAATKSGGFGEPDALIQVVDYFSCQKP